MRSSRLWNFHSRHGAMTCSSGASAAYVSSKRTWSLPLPVQPCASAQCREHEVAHELLAQIFDDAIVGARALRFRDQAVELAESLPHVRGEADDARAVLLAQPGDDGGGVEPARIGEHHEGAGLFMHMG